MFPYQLLVPVIVSMGLLYQIPHTDFILTKKEIEDIIINT